MYLDASKECESSGEIFTIPDIPQDKRKTYPTVHNCADLEHLLRTLSYWAVGESDIPETIVPYCLSATEAVAVADVLREFQINFPRLAQLVDIIIADSAKDRRVLVARYGRTDIYAALIATALASDELRYSCKMIAFEAEVVETAAQYGQLDFVRDLVERKVSLTRRCLMIAAQHGHRHVLQYLHEEKGLFLEKGLAIAAAEAGQLSCLVFVHKRTSQWDRYVTAAAAGGGHLHILQYASEEGLPLDAAALQAAQQGDRAECVEYLLSLGISS